MSGPGMGWCNAVADPGFPIGGHQPIGGDDLRCGRFSAEMYAKMKELGPVGGGGVADGAPWSQRCHGIVFVSQVSNQSSMPGPGNQGRLVESLCVIDTESSEV